MNLTIGPPGEVLRRLDVELWPGVKLRPGRERFPCVALVARTLVVLPVLIWDPVYLDTRAGSLDKPIALEERTTGRRRTIDIYGVPVTEDAKPQAEVGTLIAHSHLVAIAKEVVRGVGKANRQWV